MRQRLDGRAAQRHTAALVALAEDVRGRVVATFVDPAARATAPHLNVLTRVLGREPEVQVDLNEVPIQPGDLVDPVVLDVAVRTLTRTQLFADVQLGVQPNGDLVVEIETLMGEL